MSGVSFRAKEAKEAKKAKMRRAGVKDPPQQFRAHGFGFWVLGFRVLGSVKSAGAMLGFFVLAETYVSGFPLGPQVNKTPSLR